MRLFSRVFIIITFNNRWILQFKKTSGIGSCLYGTAVTQWMLTQAESEETDMLKNTRISHPKEQELQAITASSTPRFRKRGALALRLCIRATKSARCWHLKRAFRSAASARIRPAQPPGVHLSPSLSYIKAWCGKGGGKHNQRRLGCTTLLFCSPF